KEGELYFAFNKNVPKKLVDQLQKGIDILKQQTNEEGVTLHQAILNRYR
ncbi:amino acid ABC transporter substrate-binding protein, partial [Vibrio vulnificus]|nr:amino acid ABC transporter substrate-binding protein [Vibrio vulnificus]